MIAARQIPYNRSRRARPPQSGVTLIDLIITVMIMGILTAAAAPRFAASLHRSRAESAAKRIKADLEWVRNQAISTSAALTVQFAPNTESYTVSGLESPTHPGQPYTVSLAAYPYRTQVVSAVCGGDSNLQFSMYGVPDSAATITVQAGSTQRTITIQAITGEVTVP